MTKNDLMDNFDDLVTDRRVTRAFANAIWRRRRVTICSTSTTSSPRGFERPTGRLRLRVGRLGDLLGVDDTVPTTGLGLRSDACGGASRGCGGGRVEAHPRLGRFPPHVLDGPHARACHPRQPAIRQIVAALNDLQPTELIGFSSMLPRLAREAQAGRLLISPRRVWASPNRCFLRPGLPSNGPGMSRRQPLRDVRGGLRWVLRARQPPAR